MRIEEISKVNLERCLEWHPGGIEEWSPSDWAVAFMGEAGEVCDAIKKLNRYETGVHSVNQTYNRDELIQKVATEIGDAYLYLDLLAQRLGINMNTAIRDTFNRVSIRESFPHRL